MSKEAITTTKKVQEKTKQVRELATAIAEIAQLPKTKGYSRIRIPAEKVEAIKKIVLQSNQKFVAEILEHASYWQIENDELQICFSSEKRNFAELLEGRETIAKVTDAVDRVVTVARAVVKVLPRPAATPDAEKGSK